MKPSKTRFTILFAFVVLIVPSLLFAQSETGSITGTIGDSSGAVIPGVTVTLTSPALIGGTEDARSQPISAPTGSSPFPRARTT